MTKIVIKKIFHSIFVLASLTWVCSTVFAQADRVTNEVQDTLIQTDASSAQKTAQKSEALKTHDLSALSPEAYTPLVDNADTTAAGLVELNALAKKISVLGAAEKEKGNYRQSITYFDKALSTLKTTNNNVSIANVLLRLGEVKVLSGDLDSALMNLSRAVEIAKPLGMNEVLYQSYTQLAKLERSAGRNVDSVKYDLLALHQAKILDNTRYIVKTYQVMAQNYVTLNDRKSAIEYYELSVLRIEQGEDHTGLIDLYITLSNMYSTSNNKEQSTHYKEKAHQAIDVLIDTQKIIPFYRRLAISYSTAEEIEASMAIDKKALEIVEKTGDAKQIATYWHHIATGQRKLGRYAEAIELSKRALRVQREYGDKNRIAELLLNLSIIYRKLGRYAQALDYIAQYTLIETELGSVNGLAAAYNATGMIYLLLGQYDMAMRNYERTLALPSDEVASKYHASALRSQAELLQIRGDYEGSLAYADKAQKIYAQIQSLSGAETVNRVIGQVYQDMRKYTMALSAFRLALSQARETKRKWSESKALIKIAEITLLMNPQEAINYATQANKIATALSARALLVEGYDVMLQAEKKLGNFKSAYKYIEIQYQLMKEVVQEEVAQHVAEAQIIREIEFKEQELQQLKRQAIMHELESEHQTAEFEILNSKNTISLLELKKVQSTRIILAGIIMLVILGMALLYNRFCFSRQRQWLLNEKSQQVGLRNTELEELNLAKDRFFSIIAHDLREPIANIVVLCETIDDNFDKYNLQQLHANIHTVRESSAQTYDLLEELLEWAMLQLRNTDPVARLHSSSEICHSVFSTITELAKSKGVNVENKCQKQAAIYADKNMINTVVHNLVVNAIKFTPRNGTVTLLNDSSAKYTTIHVKDGGSHMNEADLSNVFSLDKNVLRDVDNGIKSTGFGLALCRDLVTKNGGELLVKNELGEGCDFYITLPNK